MIASLLKLSRRDMAALKITDAYSLHRVVYDLFEDVRDETEKNGHRPSGILYADKGGDFNSRQVLILSNRKPRTNNHGELEVKNVPNDLLGHPHYRFEITINPTRRDSKSRKLIPVRGSEPIKEWFCERAPESWGFSVHAPSLQVKKMGVHQFEKKKEKVTLGFAILQGNLTVTQPEQFKESFYQGIGRARAFGCGLLQIVPHATKL